MGMTNTCVNFLDFRFFRAFRVSNYRGVRRPRLTQGIFLSRNVVSAAKPPLPGTSPGKGVVSKVSSSDSPQSAGTLRHNAFAFNLNTCQLEHLNTSFDFRLADLLTIANYLKVTLDHYVKR